MKKLQEITILKDAHTYVHYIHTYTHFYRLKSKKLENDIRKQMLKTNSRRSTYATVEVMLTKWEANEEC